MPKAVFTKKVGGRQFVPNGKHLKHGVNGWAEIDGVEGRTLLYFNEYLPQDVLWESRWMTLCELRKTPQPVVVGEGDYISRWLRRKIDEGRVVIVSLQKASPDKTESVGRRCDPKTVSPIGTGVYA